MNKKLNAVLAAGALVLGMSANAAIAKTELRMTWYNDGIEGEVMQGLLDKFESSNPSISVELDVVYRTSARDALQEKRHFSQGAEGSC